MTREEIQSLIYKGGFIYWETEEPQPILKPLLIIEEGKVWVYDYDLKTEMSYSFDDPNFREATEEEIKKYIKP